MKAKVEKRPRARSNDNEHVVEAPPWSRAATILAKRVREQGGRSKNLRIKEAITTAVIASELRRGDQLPPEPHIAELTGTSLGTARRALEKLNAEGIVSREHGRGTFVSADAQHFNERWHFRFRDPASGAVVPTELRLLERRFVDASGPWRNVLPEEERYLSLRRLVLLPDGSRCVTDLVLSATQFGDLLEVTSDEIERLGVRYLIADRYQKPVLRSAKYARAAPLPDEIAEIVGAPTGAVGLRVTIVGLTFDGEAVFHLTVWSRAGRYEIDLSPLGSSPTGSPKPRSAPSVVGRASGPASGVG